MIWMILPFPHLQTQSQKRTALLDKQSQCEIFPPDIGSYDPDSSFADRIPFQISSLLSRWRTFQCGEQYFPDEIKTWCAPFPTLFLHGEGTPQASIRSCRGHFRENATACTMFWLGRTIPCAGEMVWVDNGG